jgi:hypothetical protein
VGTDLAAKGFTIVFESSSVTFDIYVKSGLSEIPDAENYDMWLKNSSSVTLTETTFDTSNGF